MKSNLATMAASLTLIAAAMGAALGLVHDITAAPIEAAKEKATTEALESVLPADCHGLEIGKPEKITIDGDAKPVTLYAVHSPEGKLIGAAVESWTMDGFSGEITVMAGFDANGAISGYRVLQSAETPGLGAKADAWFRDTQAGRSIIGTTQPLAVSKDGGQIDAITAATITSRAFLGAINRARAALQIYTTGTTAVDTTTQASPKKQSSK